MRMKNRLKAIIRPREQGASTLDRRTFLKRSTQMGLAGLAAATLPRIVWGHTPAAAKPAETAFPDLKFREDGTFKILQLTDTHYVAGDPRSRRALLNVEEMLDLEKPDLVIHTGDIIYGKPAEESLREILTPISTRRIPFAVTFGNHDEEFYQSENSSMSLLIFNMIHSNFHQNILYAFSHIHPPILKFIIRVKFKRPVFFDNSFSYTPT